MDRLEIQKIFTDTFGGAYSLFAAPGRVNLIGEHTDYNEGFVLPASIDKMIYLAIQTTSDNKVSLFAADLNEHFSFHIGQAAENPPHWALYIYGLLIEFEKAGFKALSGFNAVFGGDIPAGAGLSSSAALESVFAIACNELFQWHADKLLLAKTGQATEHNHVGVRCGIMDQFASIFGKKDHVIRLDCQSLKHEYFPLRLNDHVLLLADTCVKHSLASSAYNQRRKSCEEGVLMLRSKNPAVKSLRDANIKMIQAITPMIGEEDSIRCEFVIEENQRVLDCCEALKQGDLGLVGQLMYASHDGLQHKYQVSCPESDLFVDIAKKTQGVLGARMMGGGFGGCTINLVHKQSVEQLMKNIESAYQSNYAKNPLFYVVNTADGAREITLD